MAGILVWLLAGVASIGAAVLWIPRELWRRFRKGIVDHLEHVIRRRTANFGRRYREAVLSNLRFIDLKGLATVGFHTPELDEVFVDVSLAYRAPHQIPEGALAQLPPEVIDRHSINDFLDREEAHVLAVVGVPGSGKTTLLRHTARTILRTNRRKRTVPILLYLRDHVEAIVADPQVGLPELARTSLDNGPIEPHGWFDQRLRAGDCVVLLDGLDEVARQEERRLVSAWVERQTQRYKNNDFVITSRPQGYRSAPITGALVLQVRSFTSEQVATFVRGWYLSVERHGTDATAEEVRPRAEASADDLLARLQGSPSLYALTVNPLLLTMIANVHRYRGALPGSRADLYGEICAVMLWRRQEAKNLPAELGGDKKEVLLRALAYTMMVRRTRDVTQSEVIAELKPAIRRMSTKLSEADFVADVSSNGLLIERESGVYSFAHLTFQEYLAATHIREKGLAKTLVDSVDDAWWRETTLLYTAKSDADATVRACLMAGTVTALSLAVDCADQGSELDPDLRHLLNEWLVGATQDPERRHLSIGVRANRALRRLVRIGGGVCIGPITNFIYNLFLLETSNPLTDGSNTNDNAPVIGVRANDAVNFVQWVNYIGGQEYRLPTREEVGDTAIKRELSGPPPLSVWLDSNEPTLWAPTDGSPNVISGDDLIAELRSDIDLAAPNIVWLLIRAIGGANELVSVLDDMDTRRSTPRPHWLERNVVERVHGFVRDLTDHRVLALIGELAVARTEYVASVVTGTQLSYLNQKDRKLIRDVINDITTELTATFGKYAGDAVDLNQWLALDLDYGLGGVSAQVQRGMLIDHLAFANRRWVSSLETLGMDVQAGWANELDISLSHLPKGGRARTDWTLAVATRLAEHVTPVITREQPITSRLATMIRLSANCLAVELTDIGQRDLGEGYRRVVAGITLLEWRASGRAPVTETIVLATA